MENKKIKSLFSSRKGQGKDFSQVGTETESLCNAWIQSSGIDELILKKKLDEDSFFINSHDTDGFAYFSLEVDNKPLALPFVWHGMMNVSKIDFYTDLMLLLYHIVGKMTNKKNIILTENKIKELGMKIPGLGSDFN